MEHLGNLIWQQTLLVLEGVGVDDVGKGVIPSDRRTLACHGVLEWVSAFEDIIRAGAKSHTMGLGMVRQYCQSVGESGQEVSENGWDKDAPSISTGSSPSSPVHDR